MTGSSFAPSQIIKACPTWNKARDRLNCKVAQLLIKINYNSNLITEMRLGYRSYYSKLCKQITTLVYEPYVLNNNMCHISQFNNFKARKNFNYVFLI